MKARKRRLFWIRLAYCLGIAADALWAVALFVPQVFGLLAGAPWAPKHAVSAPSSE